MGWIPRAARARGNPDIQEWCWGVLQPGCGEQGIRRVGESHVIASIRPFILKIFKL